MILNLAITEPQMATFDALRQIDEAEVDRALHSLGRTLPIGDEQSLALILCRLLGGPVSQEDVVEALDGSSISLPLSNCKHLIAVYHRIIDLRFGGPQDTGRQ
nr:hypothetical protein TQ38_27480 [Novosphingobium sp. P6W]